jgi:hypothetical protein
VSKVLHPRSGFNHTSVGLTILRPIVVFKASVRLQGIGWSRYLGFT